MDLDDEVESSFKNTSIEIRPNTSFEIRPQNQYKYRDEAEENVLNANDEENNILNNKSTKSCASKKFKSKAVKALLYSRFTKTNNGKYNHLLSKEKYRKSIPQLLFSYDKVFSWDGIC